MKPTRIVTVVGTRPEIIRLCDWEQEVIFTGQHNDFKMGQQFLTEFSNSNINLKKKVHHLPHNINHSDIDVIVLNIEKKLKEIGYPDIILVHGDTRSALAGALAGHNCKIIIAHTEAGVRCSDETIEQRYRKQIDNLAHYNFCPVPIAVEYLAKEHITKGVYYVGDILYDSFLKKRSTWNYVFVTIHRRENILNEKKLKTLIDSLEAYPQVILPLHPHTKKQLAEFNIKLPKNVIVLEPLTHKETLRYIKDAELVLTDSGGVQREAFWSGTPCKMARKATEWGFYTSSLGAFGDGKAGDKVYKILTNNEPHR